MIEYIKMGIGFSLGIGITMAAINAFNKIFGGESKPETEGENKPEDDVVTDEVV